MEPTQVIIRPVVSEKSYVLAAGRQVHVPRPRRRPQDPDPPGRRSAVLGRRPRGADQHGASPSPSAAVRRRVAPGRGRRPSCRSDRVSRSRSSRAWKASRGSDLDADSQAQAHESRDAGSSPIPTSPRSPRKSPRRRSSRASRSRAGATPTVARPSRHRGGGAKRLYRKIDFKRRKDGVPAKVAAHRVRPEPRRVHRAAALRRRREALHPRAAAAAVGDDGGVGSRRRHPRRQLRCRCRRSRPARSSTTSSCTPGRGGQLGRSAGSGIQLLAKDGDMATLRLPSGEMRMVRAECRATSA